MPHEALLWKHIGNKTVQCNLCNRRCIIQDGNRGLCRVRENRNGILYALTYAKPCSIAIDPIEKKPLFHFLPGTSSLSIATVGCNFFCKHCQNWEISQAKPEDFLVKHVFPDELVSMALKNNCKSIAYTYTEPTIFFEYAFDTSNKAHEHNIKNVYVTNGYMTKEMLDMYKSLDGANVDIKGDERFYHEVCGGVEMEWILRNIKLMKRKGIHVEVTNLIIPGYNDDLDSILQIAQFCKDTDPDMPLHFTAFYPAYKMTDVPPTKREILIQARKRALDMGINYVYCGNTYPGDPYENTYCPTCNHVLIKRHGFSVLSIDIHKNRCPNCNTKIPIVL